MLEIEEVDSAKLSQEAMPICDMWAPGEPETAHGLPASGPNLCLEHQTG